MKLALEKFFALKAHNTNIQKEILAGITTFITMAYIIFVNPQMMAQSGMDYGAIFVGTCLAAAFACLFMGLYANWPVGLAPGMGLNAFFTYTVVGEMGYSWEIALGAVFIAGILFFIMSITPLRRWMLDSIPLNLRIAMGAGVGLFIGFIGLKNGGIIVANGATFLSLGDFTNPSTLLAGLGFLLISILSIRKIPGAIIIGILAVTLMSIFLNLIEFDGIFAISDYTAVGAIECLKKNNFNVPNDVKVVGFNNWPFSDKLSPSLSTLDQPGELMGNMSFKLFLKEIRSRKNKTNFSFEKKIFKTKLVIRESSL